MNSLAGEILVEMQKFILGHPEVVAILDELKALPENADKNRMIRWQYIGSNGDRRAVKAIVLIGKSNKNAKQFFETGFALTKINFECKKSKLALCNMAIKYYKALKK